MHTTSSLYPRTLATCQNTLNEYTGWPNKNRTFFEMPYFCSHYRYNHAVFAEVFRNYSRKQVRIFFERVLNILCKLVKIWYLVNVSANRL